MNGQNSMPCSLETQSTLVAGKKRIRSTSVCVWLSPDEQAKIRKRMADVGIRNLSAYMRKMALNGYVLHVDLAPVKEIVSLQRRCANNLNQIAVRVNTCGGVYPEEIKTLQKDYADLWGPLSELLEKLPAGLGAPQQAFSQSENCKCYTLALLAVSALPQNCVIVETAYS